MRIATIQVVIQGDTWLATARDADGQVVARAGSQEGRAAAEQAVRRAARARGYDDGNAKRINGDQ